MTKHQAATRILKDSRSDSTAPSSSLCWIRHIFTALILLAFCSLLFLPSSSYAQTQTLNLGTIVQKSKKKAPVYLKLPNSVPLPKPDPRKGGANGTTSSERQAQEAQDTPPADDGKAGAIPANDATPDAIPGRTQTGTAPQQVPQQPKIQPGGIANLSLRALLMKDGDQLQRGVNWRVYEEKRQDNGRLPMVHDSKGGSLQIKLPTGIYVIYCGYGYTSLTKRIILDKTGNYGETFTLNAGAMRLNAVAAGDVALDKNLLSFDIYDEDNDGGGKQKLIAKNIKVDHVVKLAQGTYHVVSNYGTSNAQVRGDVEVKSGKLINVTMIHHAAKITLRLVSEPGGEALANTIWTVLTPGGDIVRRAIGAFPTLALAEGDYTAIAKQGNEIYNRDFSVDSGLDRDVEVLAGRLQ